MQKTIKRFLALLLIIVMVFTAVPLNSLILIKVCAKDNYAQLDEESLYYQYISINLDICSSTSELSQYNNGVFSALVRDFDCNGIKELVTFSYMYNSLSLDLYSIENNEVVLMDNKILDILGAGNYEDKICGTANNNTIKLFISGCGYGGSSYHEKFFEYSVNNNKFTITKSFSLYEFYRYDIYDYADNINNIEYQSKDSFVSAVKNNGFNYESHFSKHNSYDDCLIDLYSSDHIFSIITTNFLNNGFVFDNTSLIAKLGEFTKNLNNKQMYNKVLIQYDWFI